MSGITPFPVTHWQVLAPAMKKQASIHEYLAGHALRGPFKHFWGEPERYVGTDKPFSTFLALGIPFEVVEHPPSKGWTFLSDFDAGNGFPQMDTEAACIIRSGVTPAAGYPVGSWQPVDDTLPALFALRRTLLPHLKKTPYIMDEKPVVCAWYPTAHAVLLWNLSDQKEHFTLKDIQGNERPVFIDGLDVLLIKDIT